MSKPTKEDVGMAVDIIYRHIINDDVRSVLFRALDRAEDTWFPFKEETPTK